MTVYINRFFGCDGNGAEPTSASIIVENGWGGLWLVADAVWWTEFAKRYSADIDIQVWGV
jgi:hypothetical protein